jgi:hypothetical protein
MLSRLLRNRKKCKRPLSANAYGLTLARSAGMTERSEFATKVWSAPVLEELTIDLAAIAAKGGKGGDGGAVNQSKS